MCPIPLVSVILPTYNRAGTLERAIRSVLSQTCDDFELIVTDDGSTDATRSILGRCSRLAKVRVVVSRHRGCAAARNLGVRSAKAPLIAFQDSDDEWLPHKLESAVRVLSSTLGGAGIFYSDMTRIHEDGSSSDWLSPDVRRGVLISEKTLDYQVAGIGIQAAVIKRVCFEAIGMFDEALPRLIDLDLFVRLSDQFDFHHHREALVRYYATSGISTDTRALVTARRYLIRKYRKRLQAHGRDLAHQHLLLADALRGNGNTYGSRALALRTLLSWPGDAQVRRKVAEVLRGREG